jgi:hypothetical protein
VQGYYFSHPLPAAAITRLMTERVRIPVASVGVPVVERVVHAPGAAV